MTVLLLTMWIVIVIIYLGVRVGAHITSLLTIEIYLAVVHLDYSATLLADSMVMVVILMLMIIIVIMVVLI